MDTKKLELVDQPGAQNRPPLEIIKRFLKIVDFLLHISRSCRNCGIASGNRDCRLGRTRINKAKIKAETPIVPVSESGIPTQAKVGSEGVVGNFEACRIQCIGTVSNVEIRVSGLRLALDSVSVDQKASAQSKASLEWVPVCEKT